VESMLEEALGTIGPIAVEICDCGRSFNHKCSTGSPEYFSFLVSFLKTQT
jgi:hypothetical protein